MSSGDWARRRCQLGLWSSTMVTDSNEVRYIALVASSFLAHLCRPGKEMESIILGLLPCDYL